MARSPRYIPAPGQEGKALAGVRPCGCITAAMSIDGPAGTEDWAYATEKDVREFYVDMAKSGREVRWMDADELRSSLTFKCPHARVAA